MLSRLPWQPAPPHGSAALCGLRASSVLFFELLQVALLGPWILACPTDADVGDEVVPPVDAGQELGGGHVAFGDAGSHDVGELALRVGVGRIPGQDLVADAVDILLAGLGDREAVFDLGMRRAGGVDAPGSRCGCDGSAVGVPWAGSR